VHFSVRGGGGALGGGLGSMGGCFLGGGGGGGIWLELKVHSAVIFRGDKSSFWKKEYPFGITHNTLALRYLVRHIRSQQN